MFKSYFSVNNFDEQSTKSTSTPSKLADYETHNRLEDNNILLFDTEQNASEIREIKEKLELLTNKVSYLEDKIKIVETENLKITNKLLEKELELERNKNSLLRHNIPFNFTPYGHFMNKTDTTIKKI